MKVPIKITVKRFAKHRLQNWCRYNGGECLAWESPSKTSRLLFSIPGIFELWSVTEIVEPDPRLDEVMKNG